MVTKMRPDERGNPHFIASLPGMGSVAWERVFSQSKIQVGTYALEVMRAAPPPIRESQDGIVVVGSKIFHDDMTARNVYAVAERKRWQRPFLELAYCVRQAFSNQEIRDMGLDTLVVMHDPILDGEGVPTVLGISIRGAGVWLDAFPADDGHVYLPSTGFVFVR